MAIKEGITRSGAFYLKIPKYDTSNLSDGIPCKLGFTPNDSVKISGKAIFLIIDNGSECTPISVSYDYNGKYFSFEDHGTAIIILPANSGATPNIDDWIIVLDD